MFLTNDAIIHQDRHCKHNGILDVTNSSTDIVIYVCREMLRSSDSLPCIQDMQFFIERI